jgi:septal ring factor EnvC (AmiA/AmiB activator)
MQMHVKVAISVLVLLTCVLSLSGQDRSTLEKKRQSLEKQIKETNSLLIKSEKERKVTVSALQTLKSEIVMREELVKSLKLELDMLGAEARVHERSLGTLESALNELQRSHAAQMRNAYFERHMTHPILFVLSAGTLNEAFLRWQYRRQIRHARLRTIEELKKTTQEIETELSSLKLLKVQKESIASDVVSQEAELKKSANQAQSMVATLEKKERALKRQLEQQQKESRALTAEIERIIAAEVKKTAATANMPAAPAVKALSAEFARNKGKLPWPVDHGLVTSRFGNQPHPIVKSITISNNGIDITAPKSSTVRCIFGGKVVGRKFIPGFDHMVIIQHGSYYTVYSRLSEVNVDINQELKARDIIGRLAGSGEDNPRLHLEIWENKSQLDPEQWIAR